jgi:hypothetical protein
MISGENMVLSQQICSPAPKYVRLQTYNQIGAVRLCLKADQLSKQTELCAYRNREVTIRRGDLTSRAELGYGRMRSPDQGLNVASHDVRSGRDGRNIMAD